MDLAIAHEHGAYADLAVCIRGRIFSVYKAYACKDFLAIFEVKTLQPDRTKHFGIMVRDDAQVKEVREKITKKYGLEVHPDFRCDFRDPWGNRIQVGDLHDESLVWLLPYREVQDIGITFASPPKAP